MSDAFKGEVATKGDIKELKNKIKDLEIRMIKWFSKDKKEVLSKWFAGVVIAQTITIVGIVIALYANLIISKF